MKPKSFRKGGIHPEDCKLSANKFIENLDLPQKALIPVGQHLGAPAKVVVKKGDKVKVGQLLAEPSAFISANVFSSVSGTVEKIEDVIDASGYKRQAVIVNVEGDEWVKTIDRTTEIKREIDLSPEEIVERVKNAGVIGMGGAAFPTHIKFTPPPGKKAEILIINGVECEPFLTSDHRLMLEKAEELLIGATIGMRAAKVDKAVIGIEENKQDAIYKLQELAKNYPGITIQPLKVNYPQGGEKQLIQAIIDKEVPMGGLPIEVGAVVINVGTTFAVYEAVQKNKPVIDRIVTVTGKSVKNPSNFRVRIGTPVSNLIEAAGGIPEDTKKIISGGPMMGKTLTDLEVPVVKATSGILIMNEVFDKEEGNCIRCGKCVNACSLGAQPYLWAQLSKKQDWEALEKEHVMLCCECGACQYVCPANIRIVDYVKVGKNKVGNIIRSRKK